jgi:hypothetical protein
MKLYHYTTGRAALHIKTQGLTANIETAMAPIPVLDVLKGCFGVWLLMCRLTTKPKLRPNAPTRGGALQTKPPRHQTTNEVFQYLRGKCLVIKKKVWGL